MAAWNSELTVADAIESVLAQTLTDWELIVVSDGSTDGTDRTVASYAANDARIKHIRTAGQNGAAASRNLGLREARAPYAAILDSDDVALPTRLERQVELLDGRPEVGATSSQLLEFGRWGGPVLSYWPCDASGIRRRQSKHEMPIPHPSVTFRRSLVLAVGGYDERLKRAEDYGLLLKFSGLPVVLHCSPDPLVMYRTTRPVEYGYVLREGQWAQLARQILAGRDNNHLELRSTTRVLTDIRSTLRWLRRSMRESYRKPRSNG